ncbi:MAG: 1,4-dihydroxy-2-naphthoate polyprenyltransferase [Acidimicrobiales bacterium]|nr:1,4-dihydroxy-2-naphthoate polyprenyltransferase [Acidimicrobiales bacterium]
MNNPWVLGARPRTLPAAVVPVVVGAACAVGADRPLTAWRGVLALVVSLALQIGTNYANDYSDGVRGTDHQRVGPVRLVASGLASPAAVKRAALVAFGVAAVAGLALAATTSWWLIAVGAASIAAAWFYTGGPKPYGYLGLGEVFVFVFFGLVATAGTTFVLVERLTGLAVAAAIPVGLLAVALLVVNNLRDIPTDAVSGKRTLAVRLGDRRTRVFYVVLLAVAFVAASVTAGWFLRPAAALALLAIPAARTPARTVLGGATGRDLIPVLGGTGRVQLLFGAAFALGLFISGQG